MTVDLTEVEHVLRGAVRGTVAFDAGSRALMTMDASNYRRVPAGVVAPADADDVAAALAVCRRFGLPVVPRGGGTSIAGQATGTGIVLDFTRSMNAVVDVDPEARTARVQPGAVLDDLRAEAARHGLTFGPDPSTHSRCTLGGMIGNNACGSHSVAWGTTADNVLALDVLTYRGEQVRLDGGLPGAGSPRLRDGLRELADRNLSPLRTGFPQLPRRISGYALDSLLPERGRNTARAFTGSEGTLGVLTEATVRLVPLPAARVLLVLGYHDESAAAEAAHLLLPHGPLTVEGMAADLVGDAAGTLPAGGAWLFVEVGGDDPGDAQARARDMCRAAGDAVTGHAVVAEPARQRALWRIREDAAGTATRMPDGSEAWPGWEDCAVPPSRLGAYLRDFRALLADHGLRGAPYGHFGDGCVHVRIDFDLMDKAGVGRFRRFSEAAADLVVSYGGSLSGEHGDGQARAEMLPKMYGPELMALFSDFKELWDPDRGMNPGMLVRPEEIDSNLRFAVLPAPGSSAVDVEFTYPDDRGDFSAAVRRCVGVAKCRTAAAHDSGPGVMCPSFRATGEEQHSTRGRARLLHEMLAGEVVADGWRSTEVRDALDLCLSCKGCRSDCPVGVDVATYKAEFLHHHYRRRLRPRAHYAMGWLPLWLRAAAPMAKPLDALGRTRSIAWLVKRFAGLAQERELPELASETFTRWWDGRAANEGYRGGPTAAGPAVVLWPDTFTDHLSPAAGRAAVRVLEAAGLRVSLPPSAVCCGLTWVSTGQLTRAKAVMRRTLDRLGPLLDAGLPLVVLEPSCAAALRTDLPELLGPADPRAARLAASVRTFAEALEEYAPDWEPPRLDRHVVGQTHCHQHAVLGDAADRRLRERAGLTGELTGGCCGLAGNFGFEEGHFEVSRACAEEALLPAVRAAAPGTAVLADGFSCRTQLAQLGGVRARHLAELLAEGLPGGLPEGLPEGDSGGLTEGTAQGGGEDAAEGGDADDTRRRR
ncbi:FAD-binding and (Fe-S)-binding domain-containing protein [Actinacidiphila rubida]|uniref:D-2-hydroxyglutarate dehydrogenase n=1 Tax=Actinacidiphila rubida TaxID=310780 RepID=A0A1H8DJ88_9ACTN|nr:FAD-binding and (Fe-S)-binding domain-containing protein [Actinacidiphila rubida]SEN07349.1 FAD/FMN-containing dehydrogenase [Actinacidiphila rubida]